MDDNIAFLLVLTQVEATPFLSHPSLLAFWVTIFQCTFRDVSTSVPLSIATMELYLSVGGAAYWTLKDVHILILGNYDYILLHSKGN